MTLYEFEEYVGKGMDTMRGFSEYKAALAALLLTGTPVVNAAPLNGPIRALSRALPAGTREGGSGWT